MSSPITSTTTQKTRPLALVTGASAGIGQSFARLLARDGYDLVLVARDSMRLDVLAKQLEHEYGSQTEVLPADLTKADQLAVVEQRMGVNPPIDLLVNNAGFGTFGSFHELPLDAEDREVRLNVLALMRLTHAAAGPMVARGSGAILNVSSVAGSQPIPGNATYAATKAFVTSFSEALHEELRGTGVGVTVLCPGFTRTEFQERSGFEGGRVPVFMWQEPDDVATAALAALAKGRTVCVPGSLNKVANAFSNATPHAITRRLAGSVIRRT
jgi:short-subunit dehydrogenase